jgi:hypothetical protein
MEQAQLLINPRQSKLIPSMIMGLVGGMGGGKKEEEKKEQPNWKANVKSFRITWK